MEEIDIYVERKKAVIKVKDFATMVKIELTKDELEAFEHAYLAFKEKYGMYTGVIECPD